MGLLGCGLIATLWCCTPQQPVSARRGCTRAVDCLGDERCDPASGRCVPARQVEDAGPCGTTVPGCDDDALNNRSPECAAAITGSIFFRQDLLLCPTVDDFYRVDVPAAGVLQVMAWPDSAVDLQITVINQIDNATQTDPLTRTDVAHVVVIPNTAGTHLVRVSSPVNVNYAIRITTGRFCTQDSNCISRRCEPLLPRVDSAAPPLTELNRGHCVDTDAPVCGDTQGPAVNRRTEAQALSLGGAPVTLGTCLDDVDWLSLDIPGQTSDLLLNLECNTLDNAFRPHLLLVNSAGVSPDVEWVQPSVDQSGGGARNYRIPWLAGSAFGPGTRYLRLGQVAGRGEATCTLSAQVVDLAAVDGGCQQHTDCQATPEANNFGRTNCAGNACQIP
ncbi:MAG: hypothetical protein AB2A00_39390 [Myxococcota bacterium]